MVEGGSVGICVGFSFIGSVVINELWVILLVWIVVCVVIGVVFVVFVMLVVDLIGYGIK